MNQIESEMEHEIENTQANLGAEKEAIDNGGLYQGIDEVASNVTYVKDEIKVVGNRQNFDGRLSIQEYEALSMTENRRSNQDPMSVLNRNVDLLSMDFGGQEMKAILERDDIQEEASVDLIQIRGKVTRGSSPGRLVRAPGTDD